MTNEITQIQIPQSLLAQLRSSGKGFSTTLGHILPTPYGPAKPVLWSEDFERTPYPNNYLTTAQSGITSRPAGWGAVDNDAGGLVAVTNDRGVNGCRSMLFRSSTAGSGKIDAHRVLLLPTGISKVGLQCWFCFSINGQNRAGNLFHFALETFDTTNHYEMALQFFPNPGTWSFAGGSTIDTYQLTPYDSSVFAISNAHTANENWHYLKMTANLGTLQSVSAIIDNHTLQGSQNVAMRALTDTSFQALSLIPLRIEFGPINDPTHSSPADDWSTYIDDIVVTFED